MVSGKETRRLGILYNNIQVIQAIVTTGHSRYSANNLVCNRRINRTTFHMSVT